MLMNNDMSFYHHNSFLKKFPIEILRIYKMFKTESVNYFNIT